jgi:hypothetical protein
MKTNTILISCGLRAGDAGGIIPQLRPRGDSRAVESLIVPVMFEVPFEQIRRGNKLRALKTRKEFLKA